MKTAMEILTDRFEYEEYFCPENDEDLNIPADKLVNAMEEYADQFKPKWIPISEYPKDLNPVVQRWHKIYKCTVSVSNRLAYSENGLDWITGTLDHCWPEEAFEPFWMELPKNPQSEAI